MTCGISSLERLHVVAQITRGQSVSEQADWYFNRMQVWEDITQEVKVTIGRWLKKSTSTQIFAAKPT